MYKLGIDIGGTKIRGVLLGAGDRVVSSFNVKTPKNKEIFFSVLEEEIKKFLNRGKVTVIGVGVPGIVDLKRNVLVKAPNLPFLDKWQVKKFFLKFCKNVKVENDSRCFLIAESKMGSGRGYKDIVGVAIGTGIGGAIMVSGKIYQGANFGAGELGHMIVDDKKTFENLAGKKAYEKYGDRSKVIGIGVANLINILNPEIVILGGGAVSVGKVKLDVVKKVAKKYIMSPLAVRTPIVRTRLGKNAQAIGAALL